MSKNAQYDLTQGGILNRLLVVAIPIMGTQLMQMTYNLTDMFWLGRLSSEAVAASGTGGMFLWLSVSLMILGRMGAEIGVSQNLGRKDEASARSYSQTALMIAIVLGVLYGALLFFGSDLLISFFGIQEAHVAHEAARYLSVAGIGIPLTFISAVITGTFNASGNSKLSFYVNAVGLVVNMILDPLMIFNMNLGVLGAAVATVIAQGVVCVLFLLAIKINKGRPFASYTYITKPDTAKIRQIIKWSTPVVLENMLFTSLAMITTRLVASFGTDAIAVQRIGSQIESLSWLIAGGFGSALTAFVGQNFGAGKWSRIHSSVRISTVAMTVWGLIISLALFFFGGSLYAVFLPDGGAIIAMGKTYLQILAVCQITSCLEAVAAGAFRGTGRTLPPSVVSISANALRVLLAYLLAGTSLGLNGIWWAIAASAILRGSGIFIWYLIAQRGQPQDDVVVQTA